MDYRESIRANVVRDFSKTDITFVGWASCESFTSIENGIRTFVSGSKLGASVHGQSNSVLVMATGIFESPWMGMSMSNAL